MTSLQKCHADNAVKQYPNSKQQSGNDNDLYTYASVLESNFGASVKSPDGQLFRHLNLDRVKYRQPHAPTRKELLENLYNIKEDVTDGISTNFYDGFAFPMEQAVRWPVTKYISNFVKDHAHVFSLIESLMPPHEGSIDFIVEAGSFIGSSANMWAKFARKNNATVLCVDTWQGDINMWVLPAFKEPMSVTYGRAHLYDNFIQNILLEESDKMINATTKSSKSESSDASSKVLSS